MSFDAHEEKIRKIFAGEIKESTFGKKNSGKSY